MLFIYIKLDIFAYLFLLLFCYILFASCLHFYSLSSTFFRLLVFPTIGRSTAYKCVRLYVVSLWMHKYRDWYANLYITYIYIYFFCGACSSWLLLYLLLLFLFHVVVILVGCNCCRSRFNVHPRRPFRSLPFSPTSFPSLYPLFPNDSSCRVSLNEMRASLPFVG